MSSLDDSHDKLVAFYRSFVAFNECLRLSLSDLETCNEAVDPLWQDEYRRRYDVEWVALKSNLSKYIAGESAEYDRFLTEKIAVLERYLFDR